MEKITVYYRRDFDTMDIWFGNPKDEVTPEEVGAGSPLFLDMTLDAQILIDKDGFFARELGNLRKRLNILGSKRIYRGNAFFWDLKPDYKPNEDIII